MTAVNRDLLAEAVGQALRALADAEDGDLPLGYRQIIWSTLGERGGLDAPTDGQRRRAALACLAGRRALPIWIKALPDDTTALTALIEAERLIHGGTDLKSAYMLRDRAILHIGERADVDVEVQCAGYAAAKALTTAINDEPFNPSDMNPSRTDRDVDSGQLDAAFFAASAEAGGPVWVSSTNPERRRKFWTWWLERAVPHAAGV